MKSLKIFFLILFVVTTSWAQRLEFDSPESQSVSSERLSKIDSVMNEYIAKGYMPGGAAIVARNGKVIYWKSFGYNDIENKIPMKKDAMFRIASQSKAITSVAVMMLYEDGKFTLDDPISRYIPEFKNPVVLDKFNLSDTTFTTTKAKREITIRDLLTHTSGIGYAQIGNPTMNAIYGKLGVLGGIGIQNIALKDQMQKLAKAPLMHQPGEKWTYGLSIDLLGYLVEVVSGISFEKFLESRLFKPLGMNDTYFSVPKEKQDRVCNLFTEDSLKHLVKMNKVYKYNGDFLTDYPKLENAYQSGGGGLTSTAYDYLQFLQMLLNGGEYNGVRILSRNTIRMMTMNQIGDLFPGNDYNKFGLGFEITTTTGSSKISTPEGVYLWGGMFSSTYWVDPKEKIVAQFFMQKFPNSFSDIHKKFKILVYQALND